MHHVTVINLAIIPYLFIMYIIVKNKLFWHYSKTLITGKCISKFLLPVSWYFFFFIIKICS